MRIKKVQKKRRRQYKTDYLNRMGLLKSGKPRLVLRLTNRYAIAQYVTSDEAKDKVVFGTTSKKLLNYGWPKELSGSLKSIPANYLTGYLVAKQIIKKDLELPIIDFGMQRVLHKTRLFAFINGLVDAGLEIKSKQEAFPEEQRIKGSSLKEDFSAHFDKIKSNIDSE